MARPKSSLAKQIADLEKPGPKGEWTYLCRENFLLIPILDLDPEENDNVQSSEEDSNSNSSDDELAGTEHYAEVGWGDQT